MPGFPCSMACSLSGTPGFSLMTPCFAWGFPGRNGEFCFSPSMFFGRSTSIRKDCVSGIKSWSSPLSSAGEFIWEPSLLSGYLEPMALDLMQRHLSMEGFNLAETSRPLKQKEKEFTHTCDAPCQIYCKTGYADGGNAFSNAKWGVQIAEIHFQTRAKTYIE